MRSHHSWVDLSKLLMISSHLGTFLAIHHRILTLFLALFSIVKVILSLVCSSCEAVLVISDHRHEGLALIRGSLISCCLTVTRYYQGFVWPRSFVLSSQFWRVVI